jgi:DNA-directed RNA polymerase specialized sigma subunit
MKLTLTPREKELAKFARDFYKNHEEIDQLINRLLLAGEVSRADICKAFGISTSAISHRANRLGLPKLRKRAG